MKRFRLLSCLHMLYLTYTHNFAGIKYHVECVYRPAIVYYIMLYNGRVISIFQAQRRRRHRTQDFRCTNTPLPALKLTSRILSPSYRPIRANPKVIQENGFPMTTNLLIRNPCRKLHRVATCCALLSYRKIISTMILFFSYDHATYKSLINPSWNFRKILNSFLLFHLINEHNIQ